MKIGPFTVSRGQLIPYEIDTETTQITKEAPDGSVTVIEKPNQQIRFFRAVIRVNRDEAAGIDSFLVNGVRMSAVPFAFTDGYGVVRTVRFWDKRVRRRYVASNLVEMDLLFRQETVAP